MSLAPKLQNFFGFIINAAIFVSRPRVEIADQNRHLKSYASMDLQNPIEVKVYCLYWDPDFRRMEVNSRHSFLNDFLETLKSFNRKRA